MPATSPQELLAEGRCFDCYGASLVQTLELTLLNRFATAASGGGFGTCATIDGSGSPVGVLTPECPNQFFRETTGPGLWQATGLTNQDWILWFGNDPSPPPVVICTAADISGTGDFSDERSGFTLNSMAINGSEAVAVGYTGQIIISDDGETWVERVSGTSSHLYAAAYGGGVWVAVGADGLTVSSPDRITWTPSSTSEAAALFGATYGEGLFVAVNGSGRVWSSPDGATWTDRASYGDVAIYNVIYGGGQFVAVGEGGFLTTSPDGITWTERVSGLAEDLYAVAYTNERFVVISGETLTTLYSTDGVTWNQSSIPSSDSTVYDVAGGGGIFLTITQESGEPWVTNDGITWTQQTPNLCPLIAMVDFYEDCRFNVSLPFLPGEDCSGVYAAFDTASNMVEHDIAVNGDFLVAVGDAAPTLRGVIRTSSNGICWTDRANPAPGLPADSRLNSVAFGNGIFLAVGSKRVVITSADGIGWALQPDLGGADVTSVDAVAFGLGMFVAVVNHHVPGPNQGDWDIYTSTDGTSWTLRQSESGVDDEAILYIEFANGVFVAVGHFDLVYTSPDGITWTKRTVPTSGQELQEVAYGNGVWVATIDDATPQKVLRSTNNGVTWTEVEVPERMFSITFGNGLFVMETDSTDEIYTSPDGLTWTLSTALYGNGRVRYYKDCTFIT